MRGTTVSGKVIVTGGGGVIGRAICARLSLSGYEPIAADLDASIPEGRDNFPYPFVTMDVTSAESVRDGVANAVPEDEQLAGLVNCAGILRDSFVGELDESKLDLMFQV